MSKATVKLIDGKASAESYFKTLAKPQREIAEALHALIASTLPKVKVRVRWGYPWYELNGENVAYLAGVAKRINFGFPRGAELDSDLLEGAGKGMRHVKVASLGEIQPRKFASLLREAAKLSNKVDAKPAKSAAKATRSKEASGSPNGTHGWTFETLMAEMKKLGTAQAVKIYKRHGMSEPMFGVSFAELNKLKKKIKVDHALAQELWASKNADARNLAMMIADPDQFSASEIDRWVKDLGNYGVCMMLGNLIGKTKFAHSKAETWIKSKDEWISQTGWTIVGGLALNLKSGLPDSYFEDRLKIIEKEIHSAKNYTRYAMNNAVICIGGRNEKLRRLAVATAKRIGKVHVDHGQTNCKTPEAVSYIEKMWARKR
ncbi:DNA alkylation repair protein [bacterium]|nr:DNA alkylation repair protein [bacterium]